MNISAHIAHVHAILGKQFAIELCDELIAEVLNHRRVLTGYRQTAEYIEALAYGGILTLAKAKLRESGIAYFEEPKRAKS